MSEKQETATTTPKRKVADYAGIAALITAISGSMTLFVQAQNQADKTEKIQASSLVLINYRLDLLERVCGLYPVPPTPRPSPSPVRRSERRSGALGGIPDTYMGGGAAPARAPAAAPDSWDDEAEEVGAIPESGGEAYETVVATEAAPAPPTEEQKQEKAKRTIKAKMQAQRGRVDFADVQAYVQESGKALQPEDLE